MKKITCFEKLLCITNCLLTFSFIKTYCAMKELVYIYTNYNKQ